jgi:hypothetical protein
MPNPDNLRPMSEFDPSKPALVHDRLNDEMFEWMPDRHMPHRSGKLSPA